MNLEHFETFSLSLIHHIIMVKLCCWGLILLLWSPEALDKEHYTKAVHTAWIDLTHSGARHGVGAYSGGQGFAHETQLGAA